MKVDIFCTVIDNYGDAGYTLRTAMALKNLNKKLEITIYTDLKELFLRLKPNKVNGIKFLNFNEVKSYEPADLCIGMFQYFPNDNFIMEMNKKIKEFIVIDYFTPERWADEANNKSCLHNGLMIPCKFYVPGLSEKSFGVLTYTSAKNIRKVNHNIYLYTPEKLNNLLDTSNSINWSGNIPKVSRMQFVSQDIFDSYVLGARYNWIRGEDTFQLALWSGNPFFWQAYPQKEEIKMLKVMAFLNFIKKFLGKFFEAYYRITLYLNTNKKLNIKKEFSFLENNYDEFKECFSKLMLYLTNRKSFQENLTEIIKNL